MLWLPAAASPQAAMEASTCASPQVAIPSRITGIGEGEIQRLITDLEGLSSSIGELKQGLEELRNPLVALSESEDPSITARCWTKQVRGLFCFLNPHSQFHFRQEFFSKRISMRSV